MSCRISSQTDCQGLSRFDYKRFEQGVAWRLICHFGYKTKLIRHEESGPEYDPVTECKEYDVMAVEPWNISQEFRNDSFIQVGDRHGLISTELEHPRHNDTIVLTGEEFVIQELQPLAPAGRVVMYEFIARR